MKISKTFIVDMPCPLCNNSETAGPFECKRCGLEVCLDCREITGLGADRYRQRILCKPCVSAVEAELALESLAGPEAKALKNAFKHLPMLPKQIDTPYRSWDLSWDDLIKKGYDKAKA